MEEVKEYTNIIAELKEGMKKRMRNELTGSELRKSGAHSIVQLKNLNEKCQIKLSDLVENTERAKILLNDKLQISNAKLYRYNRLKCQINEENSTQADKINLVSINEFYTSAPKELVGKSKNCKHDLHLARLEYELLQRKQLTTLVKQKQEELIQLKQEIMEKECSLSTLEPGIKMLLEATKPLLSGLELELETLNKNVVFESFEDLKLTDSLMCLYRQSRNRERVSNDVITKYQRENMFTVEFNMYKMEFIYDEKFECVLVKSNICLDSVGIDDNGLNRTNMFGQLCTQDPNFVQKISDGYRCYRWLQNICGMELILKEDELLRVSNFDKFIDILSN